MIGEDNELIKESYQYQRIFVNEAKCFRSGKILRTKIPRMFNGESQYCHANRLGSMAFNVTKRFVNNLSAYRRIRTLSRHLCSMNSMENVNKRNPTVGIISKYFSRIVYMSDIKNFGFMDTVYMDIQEICSSLSSFFKITIPIYLRQTVYRVNLWHINTVTHVENERITFHFQAGNHCF